MKYWFVTLLSTLFLTYALAVDKICLNQKDEIEKSFNELNPVTKHAFKNDSHKAVQLTWIGENTGKMIIISFNTGFFTLKEMFVYLSLNNGKKFENITDKLSSKQIFTQYPNVLFRNHYFSNQIYILGTDISGTTKLYYTLDGANTWENSRLPFILVDGPKFHTKNKLWLLAKSHKRELFISKSGGKTWEKIADNVHSFYWPKDEKNEKDIIILEGIEISNIFVKILSAFFARRPILRLKKSTDNGKSWKQMMDKVYGIYIDKKYLYISVSTRGSGRKLMVSTDFGTTFKSVYLPSIVRNQFYNILDIEDDMVFIHVDNPNNNGSGILYTSDSDGLVFSESLRHHFVPSSISNYIDFYKVQSMRGVYITSVLNSDNSISSYITFNKGAEWKKIRKPDNEPCHDKGLTDCYLQISSSFSKTQNVITHTPISTPTAVGIIMAHGHLSVNKKNSPPDVFISSDGGYNWFKALNGPHNYQIADHGGLLVAVQSNSSILKFSTDEGRCWHSHKFSKENFLIQKVVTEPGNKAMVVALWGYDNTDKKWVIHVLDLSELLKRECNDSDYEKWLPHSEMMHPSGDQYSGCLLGKKETFYRLKRDSLCRNGYSHEVKTKSQVCPCTKDDYECEYGYYRPVNSMDCIRNKMIQEDLCVNGVIEKIITQGYKKIPGDICNGGFAPNKTQQKMIQETCDEISNEWKKALNSKEKHNETVISKEKHNETVISNGGEHHKLILTTPNPSKRHNYTIGITIGVILTIVLVGVMLFLFISRWRIIRQKQSNLRYKIIAGLRSNQSEETGATGANETDEDDDAELLHTGNNYDSTSPAKKPKKVYVDGDADLITDH